MMVIIDGGNGDDDEDGDEDDADDDDDDDDDTLVSISHDNVESSAMLIYQPTLDLCCNHPSRAPPPLRRRGRRIYVDEDCRIYDEVRF